MRLVMAEGTRSPRVWLEPETSDEEAALQGCAARAEWTNGRGAGVLISRPRCARPAVT